VADKYRVLRRLGAGGFGCVYLAEHVTFEALRALKVLHERFTYDSRTVRRFLREAKAIYRLTAPNTVRLEDFGEVRPGVPFMAMEFAEGRSLASLLAEEGRFSPRRALHIARQVAVALVDAAKVGVLHRDLKPENIKIHAHPHRGETVKVLDFGISKILDEKTLSTLTDTGIVGTPEYMAPEQWKSSRTVDARADLFSLGVILFEVLTGDVPWERRGGDPFTVFTQMESDAAPRISEVLAGARLPRGLDELVRDLLAADRERRIGSAREVVRRIDRMKVLSTGAIHIDQRFDTVPSRPVRDGVEVEPLAQPPGGHPLPAGATPDSAVEAVGAEAVTGQLAAVGARGASAGTEGARLATPVTEVDLSDTLVEPLDQVLERASALQQAVREAASAGEAPAEPPGAADESEGQEGSTARVAREPQGDRPAPRRSRRPVTIGLLVIGLGGLLFLVLYWVLH
jgi:serine/threonine-protein kinase